MIGLVLAYIQPSRFPGSARRRPENFCDLVARALMNFLGFRDVSAHKGSSLVPMNLEAGSWSLPQQQRFLFSVVPEVPLGFRMLLPHNLAQNLVIMSHMSAQPTEGYFFSLYRPQGIREVLCTPYTRKQPSWPPAYLSWDF